SSVVINHDAVYVALEGHGVWRIENPEFAPIATYFEPASTSNLGRLVSADGRSVISADVDVLIREPAPCPRAAADCLPIKTSVKTESDGSVPMPSAVSQGRVSGRVVELVFEGQADLAPTFRTFTP